MPEQWEKSVNREPPKKAPKPRESLERGANTFSQKKIDYIASKWKLQGAREKFKKAQEDRKAKETNNKNAVEALKGGLASELPGEVPADGKTEVDTEAHDLKTLEESIAKEEKAYQEKMESMLKEEKWKIDESDLLKEEKEKKIVEVERDYINKYATDMELGQKKSPDLKYVAKNFPSAWKETLLNPESIKNPELHKVREEILTESKNIQKNAWEQEVDYQKRLLDNFHEQTGLNISQAEFEKFMWINTETQNTSLPAIPSNAPTQTSESGNSNSWVANAVQQAPAQRTSSGWSGNNSSWGDYSSSGGWSGGWSGSWYSGGGGGNSSGESSIGGGSSSGSSSTPSETTGPSIEVGKSSSEIVNYAVGLTKLPREQAIMWAEHCTDWVDKVFRKVTGKSVYETPKTYNAVRKISWWDYGGTAAPKEVVDAIKPWQHLMLDKPSNGQYNTGHSHSVIAIDTPVDWMAKVVSYPNGGKQPVVETYDLLWLWRPANKQGRVIRIQWV